MTVFICPKCRGTELSWDYGLKTAVCRNCRTPLSKWHARAIVYIQTERERELTIEQEITETMKQMEKLPHEEILEEPPTKLILKEGKIKPETKQEPHLKIREDLLPADYDQIIRKEKLVWDPYNPRLAEPLDDLVESIRKTGLAEAIIVHPGDDGKFYVTDGWQRAQACVMAGWDGVPCKVYPTPLEALEETDRRGIKKEWTKYERMKFYRNFYDACRDAGMKHEEAIQRIIRKTPAIEQRILTYLRITRLPPLVQVLLKEPKNRTPEEWGKLEKIYYTVKRKRKALNIGQASIIAKYLRRFPPEKQVRAAIGVLGLTIAETDRKIRVVAKYPEEDPLEIILEHDIGYGIDEILDIGLVTVNPQLKRYLLEFSAMRRVNLREFIVELLNEWWIREKISQSIELEKINSKTKPKENTITPLAL